MKRSWYVRPGNLSSFKLVEKESDEIGSGEVRVDVKCIGLNFADVLAGIGLYKAAPKDAFVPGLEFSGVVTEVGENIQVHKVGDRVMGVTRFGAYTTEIVVPEQQVFSIPYEWSFAEAASYLVSVLTAYYALVYLGQAKADETVLIHSAAGGVGGHAVEIAGSLGLHIIGTTGTEEKRALLEKTCDEVIVRDTNFEKELKNVLDGSQLNIVMECIGGSVMQTGFELLAPRGRMVIYGAADFINKGPRPNWLQVGLKYLRRPRIDMMNLKNKTVSGFNLIYLFDHLEQAGKVLEKVNALNLRKPMIGKTYSFNELPSALEYLQSGKSVGKVVVIID